MGLFNKRLVKFYGVFGLDNKKEWISIFDTLQDAVDYSVRLTVMTRIEHYQGWCQLRNINPDDSNSLYTYFNEVLNRKYEYKVMQVRYTLKQLATILRIEAKSIPLGGAYHTKLEYYVTYDQEGKN